MMPRLSAHMTVMQAAAQKAARRLLRDFNEVENLQVSMKGPGDFVSQADLRADQTLRRLEKARPGYAFLMEESGASGSDKWAWRWVVDPLDGTTNFLHGIPHWAISIGLERRLPDEGSEIVAGVVYSPVNNELFWAEKVSAPMSTTSACACRPGARCATRCCHGHPLRGDFGQQPPVLCPHAEHADAASRRHPPLRLGHPGSRLGRRRSL